jgi:hypothetical protein
VLLQQLAVDITLVRLAVRDRVQRGIAALSSDRGEGPVSAAIMVAVVAAAALLVAGIIAKVATDRAGTIPGAPAAPAGH